jgi:hypothetical protein
VADPSEDDDGITTADAQAELVYDLGAATARLQEILGRYADRPISSLPKWERDEVRQIRAMIAEWLDALREARRS